MSRKTRKLIWSAPLLVALAVVGALAIFAALAPGNASADGLPGAPMNLEVEAAAGDAGRTTLTLTWTAAAGATGYRIDKSDQGAVWEAMVENTDSAATTYTDSTLTASDTRWYRVFAVSDHGVGPVSNAVSGTTDDKVNPGSVMNLRAMPNEKMPRKRIDLSWDAPADGGGEMIVGYEIQAHVNGGWASVATSTSSEVTVATKTSYMDKMDRDPGDSQLYRVRAVNGTMKLSASDSAVASAAADASKEWVQVTGTTQAATAPGQVTGLTAVNTANDTIVLYWYDPEDTGGWDISGYVIQAHREGKKFPSVPDIEGSTKTASNAPDLGSGDNLDNAYWYQGKSNSGSIVQATFDDIAAVDHDGDSTTPAIQVKWYFRVYAITTDNGPDDDSSMTVDDVIRRSAQPSNTASNTAASRKIDHDSDGGTITLDPLAAPALTATSPENNPPDGKKQQIDLSVTVASDLTSAVPPVEQIAYRVDYSTDMGQSWMLLERDTRFTGFGPGRPYEDDKGLGFDEDRSYRIFAIGRHPYTDVGPASAMVTGMTAASTVPDKPTGVTASSPSLRSIEASWTAPEDNGGQPITKYLVQWVMDDGDEVAEADDFTNGSPADDSTSDATTMGTFDIAAATALEDDTLYVFRVAGVNTLDGTERPASASETGDFAPKWSTPVLFNTTEAAAPTAVEGLTSEAATDASGTVTGVNLLWNKPSNKIAIAGYEIEVMDDEGDWIVPLDGEALSANRTSYTDPDEPEADEMRTYRVRATNDAGEGPWTQVMYPRDPAADHTHTPPALGNASGISGAAQDGDPGSVDLTWTAGDNATHHFIAGVRKNNDGSYDFGNTVWEWAVSPSTHTVNRESTVNATTGSTNLAAGTYAFTVISGQHDQATNTTTWAYPWATPFAEVDLQ